MEPTCGEFCLLTCPLDVISIVVNYLALRSIVRLGATCHHFREMNCPGLMRSIVLNKREHQIRPATEKLAIFRRLEHLSLNLRTDVSSNPNSIKYQRVKDIYQGLEYLTTLGQLQKLTLGITFGPRTIFGFWGSYYGMNDSDFHSAGSFDILRYLSTKLETLKMSVSSYRSVRFLEHLTNLKHLVLDADLKEEDTNAILKLTKLTNMTLSTRDSEHESFYHQLSALKSLQVFVDDCSKKAFNGKILGPLYYICISLPNLHTLAFTCDRTYSIPDEITNLEQLRILRLTCSRNNEIRGSKKLWRLPYLEVQTHDNETAEILRETRQQTIEEMRANMPSMSDEDIEASLARFSVVDKIEYSKLGYPE